MKIFKTTGACNPDKHYMVDINDRVSYIKSMIYNERYLTISRARQYGKTTTLAALKRFLSSDYVVVNLDFQGISNAGFSTEEAFVQEFCRLIIKRRQTISFIPDIIENKIIEYVNQDEPKVKLSELFVTLNEWCAISDREIVLIIDEVDSATNNQVFLDFLSQLRDGYIARDTEDIPTFKSVLLAGVTDVKHLKSMLRDENQAKVNSPWNIADDVDIDMSLSVEGIKGMLGEYEGDKHTGMDVERISEYIYNYTSGYPFLVSKICQLLDNSKELEKGIPELPKRWTIYGVDEAVRLLLKEENVSLFESLMVKLVNYPELKKSLYQILVRGETIDFMPYDEEQKQLRMYGFVKEKDNKLIVSNMIF